MNSINISQNTLTTFKKVCEDSALESSKSLSRLLNKKINIELSKVAIIPPNKIHEVQGFPEDIYTSVLFSTDGLKGSVLCAFDESGKSEFFSEIDTNTSILHSSEDSFFAEVSNIITGAFLVQLNIQTGISIHHSIPSTASNMLKALIDEVGAQFAQTSENVLVFLTNFQLKPSNATCMFLFILEAAEAGKLISKLSQE